MPDNWHFIRKFVSSEQNPALGNPDIGRRLLTSFHEIDCSLWTVS